MKELNQVVDTGGKLLASLNGYPVWAIVIIVVAVIVVGLFALRLMGGEVAD